jgi:hypothetical protein
VRIHVTAEETIDRQARTYAEYRLFAALSQLVGADQVRDARVLLRACRQHGRSGISCTVTVRLTSGDALRIGTTDAHAYAAINRAVERLRAVRVADGEPRMYAGTTYG